MPLVVAFDDLTPSHAKRRSAPGLPGGVTTAFYRAPNGTARAPTAIHAQYDPGSVSSAHFHTVDQFQIIIDGKGRFGRHDVAPYCVHFSRAYTPYGPLHADKETGWIFLTLRTRHDPGAQRLPAAADKLKEIPDRHPWQITRKASFPGQASAGGLQEIPDIKDEHGLHSYALSVAPGMRAAAPDPSSGDGQYVVVVKGSLMHDGREHKALTLVYIEPQEGAFQLHAGPQGLEALVVNFPEVAARKSEATAQPAAASAKRKCVLCDFTYIEALGMPDDGIAAGTRWEDIAETWTCPDCGASKADFEAA